MGIYTASAAGAYRSGLAPVPRTPEGEPVVVSVPSAAPPTATPLASEGCEAYFIVRISMPFASWFEY